MGLEFPNYQSYDLLARSFGRISLGKSATLQSRKNACHSAPTYSDENETLKSLSMTESHYSSNLMAPTKSVSSIKSSTKKKRRRSSAAKKEIEFVRSVSSGSSGIESMSSLDGHSTGSGICSSNSKLEEYEQPILKSYLRLQQTICTQCSDCTKCEELVRNTPISLHEDKENRRGSTTSSKSGKKSRRRGSSMPRPTYIYV
ncbi:Oidioi.mRNA.OKI2018_I69.chr2.g6448.t1.cds [Oikopleura dioica]|uniref:Oidioi.mRNA.OKI2018_I69.chr2.g6448.t1.cds n=1 Tax=Oikopleura dioica TaxID=34765 RepID=A0ABN7T408_OIKDI|nr:Oidioi.mRNA.OKI2018_I69.chr2.g6448.t1.cds [Oikopleura dioica]